MTERRIVWRMFLPLRQIRSLSTLSALEILREPVCLLLITTCALLQLLNPVLIIHPFGEPGKLARDGALAFHFVFGLFVAAYGSSSALNREVRNGTAAAVLAKPVSRHVFFLSKFFGIALVVLLFSVLATCGTLLNQVIASHVRELHWVALLPLVPVLALAAAALMNYLADRPFVASAFLLLLLTMLVATTAVAFVHGEMPWRVVRANLLITCALLMLAAIAVTLSTRLRTAPTVVGCTMAFLLGLVSDYLFGRHAATSMPAALLYRLTPNWQHFWVTDGLVGDGTIPWDYLADAMTYGGLYLVGVLLLGLALFQSTELE